MNNLNNGLSEFSGNNVIDDLTHINSSKDLPHKENDYFTRYAPPIHSLSTTL